MATKRLRHLVLVLGDQLSTDLSALDGFDAEDDAVWMAEVAEEATHVWAHKQRLVLFFAAMRHFRDELRQRGWRVEYHPLTADPEADAGGCFADVLARSVVALRPAKLMLTEPGDWRVRQQLTDAAKAVDVELDLRDDRHFYCSRADFAGWADGRKTMVMEHFYRWMRQRTGVLMRSDGQPEGGQWNFDHDNRETFGKDGPPMTPGLPDTRPDDLTRDVMAMVETRFADHPGQLQKFDWPVTRRSALAHLRHFIEHRLPDFGRYEDAMWDSSGVLFHSRLSAALNLHLLDPRECVAAAVEAWRDGHAPLNSVEGFVRQILGWREFVRGIYWQHMPDYATLNALECDDRDVPAAFWTGDTDMNCVRCVMGRVVEHAWTHHIERLMVLGLYAQLLGVHPRRFHDWHMAMYADAIDWVSLPNTLGMSQFGDGGIVGTKPYCASGKYIDRMSNFCKGCRYDPAQSTGDRACPITTLYWDFLARHRRRFAGNPRMAMQLRNLDRMPSARLTAIRRHAATHRAAP